MQSYSLASTVSADDPRQAKWAEQRLQRGFDNTELWNLFHTIASFTLPRLIAFKTVNKGYPGSLTPEIWDKKLDEMIAAFTIITEDHVVLTNEQMTAVETGLDSFRTHFHHLWI